MLPRWLWCSGGLLSHVAVALSATQKPLPFKDSNPFTDDYRKFALKTLEKWRVPGVSVAVVDGDDIYLEGFGYATLPSTPATSSTLYMAGSTTKAFTNAALGLMIASGNYSTPPRPGSAPSSQPDSLSWTTPISTILPDDFVMADPWATTHLTLEDAASHRTGLSRHDSALPRFYGTGADRHNATVRDVVRLLRWLPMAAEPRTKWQYCNLMYATLSHCVETLLGGRWLGDVLREWIWAPLGMHSTYFSLEEVAAAPEHLASGYYWDEETSDFKEIEPMGLREISGAGAVVTNVHDYALWVKSLLTESGPLSKDVHAALRQPKMVMGPDRGRFDAPLMYASGWMLGSYKGHRFFTHSGGMEAYGAEIFFFPDDNYGVVTLGNTAFTSNAVGEILLGKLVDERFDLPSAERDSWENRWTAMVAEIRERFKNVTEILYPDHAKHPKIQPALPLSGYAGSYYHPAYQNITLELSDSEGAQGTKFVLEADHTDATWQTTLRFEHISGEYWVMTTRWFKEPSLEVMREFAKAQFKLGVDGKVSQL